MPLLDQDRLFPIEPSARALARELYAGGARPADRQPARPHRPALVRRGRGLPRPGAAVRHPRPLRLPHAALAGHPARRSRRAARRRRADRDRRPGDLAAARGELPPAARHAVAALARPHVRDGVRPRPAALGRDRRRLLRPYRRLPRPAGVPAAGAVRALRDRGDRDDREPARRPALARGRSATRAGAAGSITAYRPDAVVDPEFPGFAANVARFGEITGCDTADWDGYLEAHRQRRGFFKAHGATSSDHGHPTARTENLPRAEAAALFRRRWPARRRRRRPTASAATC